MVKKTVFVIAAVLLVVFVYSLSQQVYQSLKAGSRLGQEKDELINLQKKNSELKKKLAEVGTIHYIEQQARDKLNFSRPNETVVVIPQEEIDKILNSEVGKRVENVANWVGWLKLFWK